MGFTPSKKGFFPICRVLQKLWYPRGLIHNFSNEMIINYNKWYSTIFENSPQLLKKVIVSPNAPQFNFCIYNLHDFITISSRSSNIPQFLKYAAFSKKRHTPHKKGLPDPPKKMKMWAAH